MKRDLPEFEYRFDLVDEEELGDCLCWESIRELCRLHGTHVPAPWRTLDDRTKGWFRRLQEIDAAFVYPVNHFLPLEHTFVSEGKKLTRVEFIDLPRVRINWDCRDKELLNALRKELATWLKSQRRHNPSAHYFSQKKAKRGRRQKLFARLVDLAVYRLVEFYQSLECQFLEDAVDAKMQELYEKLDPEAARKAKEKDVLIRSGKVGNRNLSHTHDRAKRALKLFEKDCFQFRSMEDSQRGLRDFLRQLA